LIFTVARLNPFIYDDPVPPSELVDREPEMEKLLELADGAHNTRLQGPRRYGKTSLLIKLCEEAERAGFRTVYADFLLATTPVEVSRRIEEAYGAALKGPVKQLFDRMRRSWKARVKAAPAGVGGELEYATGADSIQRLADLLDLPRQAFEASGERTIVVFDEFQDFLRAEGQLDGLLRSKIQFHREAAAYVFSGSEQALLAEYFDNRERPLFDQARPIYLQPLPDAALGDYIASRFSRSGKDAGEALDLLLNLVRGHPQRAMLVAHHLWDCTPIDEPANADTLDQALEQVDRETKERFESTWQGVADSANKRRVLKALAISSETLFNQRTLRAFDLSKGQVQSGLKGLLRDGEVVHADGRPILIDPLLERWIRVQEAGSAPSTSAQ
jgi:uncharacterized protein